jgi:hypothetical protein
VLDAAVQKLKTLRTWRMGRGWEKIRRWREDGEKVGGGSERARGWEKPD